MIPSNVIDDVRERSDIVAVVSEYVKLKKSGKNYLGLCPFHSEKTPSFTVSPEKKLFHCFGCGEGGNIFAFMMKIENCGFQEAARLLGEKVGIAVPVSPGSSGPDLKNAPLYEAAGLAARYFHENLINAATGAAAKGYLHGRNIGDDAVSTFNLGFALDSWDGLLKHLVQRGVSLKDIEGAGLVIAKETGGHYDRFRNRIMFPIRDHRGKDIAFGGRILGDGEPKYMNSPESPVYSKGRTLYGLDVSKDHIKKKGVAVLVEGNLDMITCFMAGIRNVVASMGTALTEEQVRLLGRYCNSVILAYDSDLAGNSATERGVSLLKGSGFTVKVARIREGKDPDELIRMSGAEAFTKVLDGSISWLRYRIDSALSGRNANDIEAKAKAIRDVARLIAAEPDRLVREEYVKDISQELRLSPETLLAEVKREGYYAGKRPGAGRMVKMSEKPRSKVTQAEEELLRIAVEDEDARRKIKENIHWGEFSDGFARSVAELLLGVDIAGDASNFIMDNIPGEDSKKKLSAILVAGHPGQNVEKAAMDCIAAIKAHRMKEKISEIRGEIEAAEKRDDIEKVKVLHRQFQEYSSTLRDLERSL